MGWIRKSSSRVSNVTLSKLRLHAADTVFEDIVRRSQRHANLFVVLAIPDHVQHSDAESLEFDKRVHSGMYFKIRLRRCGMSSILTRFGY